MRKFVSKWAGRSFPIPVVVVVVSAVILFTAAYLPVSIEVTRLLSGIASLILVSSMGFITGFRSGFMSADMQHQYAHASSFVRMAEAKLAEEDSELSDEGRAMLQRDYQAAKSVLGQVQGHYADKPDDEPGDPRGA